MKMLAGRMRVLGAGRWGAVVVSHAAQLDLIRGYKLQRIQRDQ